jgi:L-lactate dehydrogenase complex protein LldG
MNAEGSPLVRRFMTVWQQRGGRIEVHKSQAAARLSLLLTLRELRVREILAWPSAALLLPGLVEALADAGIALFQPERGRLRAELAVGLTDAAAGLAATGSLVLAGPFVDAWLPALLPVYALVLLPVTQLFEDLVSWQRAQKTDDLGSVLLVGGPSVSADIEWHAHPGMFGPRQLHVLLLPPPETGA